MRENSFVYLYLFFDKDVKDKLNPEKMEYLISKEMIGFESIFKYVNFRSTNLYVSKVNQFNSGDYVCTHMESEGAGYKSICIRGNIPETVYLCKTDHYGHISYSLYKNKEAVKRVMGYARKIYSDAEVMIFQDFLAANKHYVQKIELSKCRRITKGVLNKLKLVYVLLDGTTGFVSGYTNNLGRAIELSESLGYTLYQVVFKKGDKVYYNGKEDFSLDSSGTGISLHKMTDTEEARLRLLG